MTTLTIDIPDDLLSSPACSADDFAMALRLAAAMFWYERGEISQERAANIAGLNRRDFLLALAREKFDTFAVDLDELKQELARG